MLHIFYIISPITEIVAESFILQEKISIENILILHSNRFIPNKIKVEMHLIDAITINHQASYPYKNPLKAFNHYSNFEKEITKLTQNKQFVFYTPHLKSNMLDLIAHHQNCIDYFYLEEGALAYLGIDEINKDNLTSNKFFRFKNGIKKKLLKRYDDYNKYGIGIYKDAFPFLKNKKIIERNIISNFLKSDSSIEGIEDGTFIIVLDPTSIYKMSLLKNVTCALISAIEFALRQNANSIAYKFHPAQIGTEEEEYYRLFFKLISNFIIVKEIHQNQSLELIFMKQKNLTVLHGMSSLGLYAEKEKHKVFSYANVILDKEPNFIFYIESYINVFKPKFLPIA